MKFSTTLFLLVFIWVKPSSAQWLQTNGPFGGGVVTTIISDSSGTIYASTGWSGYFKSADNGISWSPINDGLLWPSGDIAVSPQGVLFAEDQQIIRSFDQGETWEPCDNGQGRKPVSIACNSLGYVYAAYNTSTEGEAGLFVSEDNGDTWNQIPVEFYTYMESIVVSVNQAGHIFLGGPETLLRSTDMGVSWTNITPQEGYATITNVCFDSADVVYACSANDGGLFKSHDNGDIWAHILTEGTNCVAAQGNLLYAATGWGMRRSTDGGMTWDSVSTGLPDEAVYSAMLFDDGTILIGTRGAYRSENNGNTWVFSSDGMIAGDVHEVTINDEGTVFAVSDKVWRTVDDGQNWVSISDNLDITEVIEMETDMAGQLYLLVNPYDTRLYKSADDGDSWIQLTLPDQGFSDIDFQPSGDLYAASNYNGGLYRSTDGGISWSLAGFPNTGFQSVYIDPQGVMLVCDENNPATIYRSDDNGNSWAPVYTINTYGYAGVTDYATDGMGFIYMATYFDLLRSDDEGLTWDVMSSGTHYSSITANQFDTLYATTMDGIWQSPDQGLTWSLFNDGLPTWGWPETIAFSAVDGTLYAGWHGQGVWSYGSHSVDVKQPEFADNRHAVRLFPNPSTGTVVITINGTPPQTPLKIFTPDGRLITTVTAREDGSADISSLKTGLYIVNSGEYSGKMVKK